MRIVVRNGFSRDLADLLIVDIERHLDYLSKLPVPLPPSTGAGFHH